MGLTNSTKTIDIAILIIIIKILLYFIIPNLSARQRFYG